MLKGGDSVRTQGNNNNYSEYMISYYFIISRAKPGESVSVIIKCF